MSFVANQHAIASTVSFMQVTVAFSNDTVRPADTVSVSVAAHPASYVGLLAVDQSVLLLREGNDITQDSVHCYSHKLFTFYKLMIMTAWDTQKRTDWYQYRFLARTALRC